MFPARPGGDSALPGTPTFHLAALPERHGGMRTPLLMEDERRLFWKADWLPARLFGSHQTLKATHHKHFHTRAGCPTCGSADGQLVNGNGSWRAFHILYHIISFLLSSFVFVNWPLAWFCPMLLKMQPCFCWRCWNTVVFLVAGGQNLLCWKYTVFYHMWNVG